MVQTCGISVLRHTVGLRKAKHLIPGAGQTGRLVLSRLQRRPTMSAQTMEAVTVHDVNSDCLLYTSDAADE